MYRLFVVHFYYFVRYDCFEVIEYMENLGRTMIEIGKTMQSWGYSLMPVSFIAYLVMTILQYTWKKISYTKGVKVLWYLVVAFGELTTDQRITSVVIMMIYMDAIDSLFEFLAERREMKLNTK